METIYGFINTASWFEFKYIKVFNANFEKAAHMCCSSNVSIVSSSTLYIPFKIKLIQVCKKEYKFIKRIFKKDYKIIKPYLNLNDVSEIMSIAQPYISMSFSDYIFKNYIYLEADFYPEL